MRFNQGTGSERESEKCNMLQRRLLDSSSNILYSNGYMRFRSTDFKQDLDIQMCIYRLYETIEGPLLDMFHNIEVILHHVFLSLHQMYTRVADPYILYTGQVTTRLQP